MSFPAREPMQFELRPQPARHGRVSLERVLGELANARFEVEHSKRIIEKKNERIVQLERQVAGLTRGFHR